VSAVLDASAALALLRDEPGAEIVDEVITGAVMSTANHAEVISRLVANGVPADPVDDQGAQDIAGTLIALGVTLAPVDVATSVAAGLMFDWSPAYGLSLGDRICLATAEILQAVDDGPVTVYTSDQAWSRIPADRLAVTIKQIR
jgi:ribonuclease VapC